jgi:signal transduction histidine kinase
MSPDDLSLLLVDDVEENLLALEAALGPMGHRIVLARSGEEALRQLLKNDEFAAVVLDVQMPGLDGFETARAIQERERTKNVPILFLTAMSRDEDHRLRGFASGAVDYIFKPVDPEVLRAKVGVFVRLYAADRELRRQREDLRRQAAELARSNADLDQFASVVSHDLLDPLNVISGYLELLSERIGDDAEPELGIWIGRMDGCARRVHKLVADLLAYARAVAEDPVAPRPSTSLADPLADALGNLDVLMAASGSSVEIPDGLPAVAVRREELAQVFQNLLANSIVHAGGTPAHVTVSAEDGPQGVTVRVSDEGLGLSAGQMNRVFGMFERTGGGPTPSTGLGLTICRRIVQRAGGRIWMEPNPGRGVSVIFTLPR